MALLEDRPDIDHAVDVGPLRSVFSDRRLLRTGEEVAQRIDVRRCCARVFVAGKDEYTSPSVGLDGVTKVKRLGVCQPDHGSGVEAHADHQALGDMLIVRLAE